MKKHKLSDLNELYDDAEACDREVFSEQRSNLLLVSGNHYNKKTTTFFSKVRQSTRLSEQQKLRLTRNHTHKVCMYYENQINSAAPGVIVQAKNEMEMQDRKSSELLGSWGQGTF